MSGRRWSLVGPTVAFVMCFLCEGVMSVISVAPGNVAVYEGAKNTTMTCVSDQSPMDWAVVPFASNSGPALLTTNGNIVQLYTALYAIDRSAGGGADTLVIYEATVAARSSADPFATAGIYQCYENQEAAVAQVVVIRSDPKCTANVTNSTYVQPGQGVQLTCTFIYAAPRQNPRFQYTIDAVLTWSRDGQTLPGTSFTIATGTNELIATSVITVYDHFESDYRCIAAFAPPVNSPPPGIASNAPAYSKACNFTYRDPSELDRWRGVAIVLGVVLAGLFLATVVCFCWCIRFHPTAVGIRQPGHLNSYMYKQKEERRCGAMFY